MLPRGLWYRIQFLHVIRQDDAGDCPFHARDAYRAIDGVSHLLRCRRHVHIFVPDVFEQADQIDFLLVMSAERRAGLLSNDCDDRLVIELRVVQTVQQVDRSRTRRGDTRPLRR